MATAAIDCRWEVRTVLASCRCSVVAGSTRRRRGVGRVVWLGSKPARSGSMATLAIASYTSMNGRRRLACHAIGSGQMARSALVGHRRIGVEASRVPGHIAWSGMARVAIG